MVHQHLICGHTVLIDQVRIDQLLAQADRLGVRHVAGPSTGIPIGRVEISALDALDAAPLHAFVIVAAPTGREPSPYQFDIAVRQAAAREFSALVVTGGYVLPETARLLADRAGVTVLVTESRAASELGVIVD